MTSPAVSRARDVSIGGVIGIFAGMVGIGGGIFLVPYLVLRRAVEQKPAQATSLVMVATASLGGAVTYAFKNTVAWAPAGLVILGGLAGAWLGTHVVQRTGDRRLQFIFGAAVVLVAIRLLATASSAAHPANANPLDTTPHLTTAVALGYVLSGVAMGFFSAMLGVGGGIVLIPVLVTVFGYQQQLASGTALAVMVPIALLGATRLSRAGLTDWSLGLRFGAGAVVGAALGAFVALALSEVALRYAFSAILAVIGVRMIVQAARAKRAAVTSGSTA